MTNPINRTLIVRLGGGTNPQSLSHLICGFVENCDITNAQVGSLKRQDNGTSCSVLLITIIGEKENIDSFVESTQLAVGVLSVETFISSVSICLEKN
jgi:hypothetical protein